MSTSSSTAWTSQPSAAGQSGSSTLANLSAPTSSSNTPSDISRPERIAEAKAAVTASLAAVGTCIDADLTARARDIHSSSAAIRKQEAELAIQTSAVTKQNARWQKELNAGAAKLKELGDYQNWAELLERDLLVLEETIRLVEKTPDSSNISGTNPPLGQDRKKL